MTKCGLCEEEIEHGELIERMPFIRAEGTTVRDVHNDCLLRSTLGGIGHHEDHNYWCKEMGDPDGGRTLRQSAREVAALVRKRGIRDLTEHDALFTDGSSLSDD